MVRCSCTFFLMTMMRDKIKKMKLSIRTKPTFFFTFSSKVFTQNCYNILICMYVYMCIKCVSLNTFPLSLSAVILIIITYYMTLLLREETSQKLYILTLFICGVVKNKLFVLLTSLSSYISHKSFYPPKRINHFTHAKLLYQTNTRDKLMSLVGSYLVLVTNYAILL